MELSETLLLGGVVVEAIVIAALLVKYHARGKLICLEPRKDRLKVEYWWLSVEFKGEPTADDLIKSEQDYEYTVEGTEILVSKEGSFDVTLASGEEEEEDSGTTNRAIRPPSNWRRPPVAKLMAIEVSVVS